MDSTGRRNSGRISARSEQDPSVVVTGSENLEAMEVFAPAQLAEFANAQGQLAALRQAGAQAGMLQIGGTAAHAAVLGSSTAVDPTDGENREDGGGVTRKVGSGRPAGVQCKCKCCGAQGFYRRSCGRKHRCLVGKCGPGGPGSTGPGGDPDCNEPDEAPTMYQVPTLHRHHLVHLIHPSSAVC